MLSGAGGQQGRRPTGVDLMRGQRVQKTGSIRRFRFRFINPRMQPFVILNGLTKELITEEDLRMSDSDDEE